MTNGITVLNVSVTEDGKSYRVYLPQGTSVAEAAFAMATVIKCFVREKIVDNAEQVTDLLMKYLKDPQYEEITNNVKTD